MRPVWFVTRRRSHFNIDGALLQACGPWGVIGQWRHRVGRRHGRHPRRRGGERQGRDGIGEGTGQGRQIAQRRRRHERRGCDKRRANQSIRRPIIIVVVQQTRHVGHPTQACTAPRTNLAYACTQWWQPQSRGKGVENETAQCAAAAWLRGKCRKQQCRRTLQVTAIFSNSNEKGRGAVSGANLARLVRGGGPGGGAAFDRSRGASSAATTRRRLCRMRPSPRPAGAAIRC